MQTHTTHSHWLRRNTSCQSNCFPQQKKKKKTLNKTPQILRPCSKQHTLISITEESIFVTKEAKLFICTNLPLQFS